MSDETQTPETEWEEPWEVIEQAKYGKLPLREVAVLCMDDSARWFPDTTNNLTVHVLGLVGEAGEVADNIKKSIRGSLPPLQVTPDNETRALVTEELVDVLIYLANIAGLLHIDLERALHIKRAMNEIRFGNPKPKLAVAKSKLIVPGKDNG